MFLAEGNPDEDKIGAFGVYVDSVVFSCTAELASVVGFTACFQSQKRHLLHLEVMPAYLKPSDPDR